jgi:hypothetical protein
MEVLRRAGLCLVKEVRKIYLAAVPGNLEVIAWACSVVTVSANLLWQVCLIA